MSDLRESASHADGPQRERPRGLTRGRAALAAALCAGVGLFAVALDGIAAVDGRLAEAPLTRSQPASYRDPIGTTAEPPAQPLSERCRREALRRL